MRKLDAIVLPLIGSLLLLTACGRTPVQMSTPYMRGYQAAQPYQQTYSSFAVRAQAPLVAVQGIATGDNLKVKGPLFTSGKGKVLAYSPDAFKIEFSIVNYHLIVDATRIDDKTVHFVTIDVNANKTYDGIGSYTQNGNVTVFDMGPGQQVERLTIRPTGVGAFETDVVQPGRVFPADSRGSNTLKFSKG